MNPPPSHSAICHSSSSTSVVILLDENPHESSSSSSSPPIENSPIPLSTLSTLSTKADFADSGEEGGAPAAKKFDQKNKNWSRWAAESIAPKSFVPPLILQAFATGVLDATTYADFETFASNQTGNIILLTLAALGKIPVKLLYTGVSFAAFLGASFIFGQTGHRVGVRRRSWVLFSTLFQLCLLIMGTIFLSPAGPRQTQLGHTDDWLVISFFAAMSGAQIVMARQSSCQELPTAPMTSPFVDFVADQHLFHGWTHGQAGPRNRRLLYLGSMIAGSFLGAMIDAYSASWVVALVTCVCKAVVIVMLVFAKAEGD